VGHEQDAANLVLSLYDILDAGHPVDRIIAWARGEAVAGLPRLSLAEAAVLVDSWEWNARPGQIWTPGPEFITSHEAGRGWGKDRSITEYLCIAARDPERWGGEALIVGVTPTQVKRDCLMGDGKSGLFPAAKRAEKAGLGPGIRSQNWNDRTLHFEAASGGGGGGLVVHWAASSDPKSVHGMSIGLAWCDEFGVWYHDKLDEQGNNTWNAMQPAVRQLPDPKIIITMTPSRHREVKALQADAERPECRVCQAAFLARQPDGRWRGERGKEPWRLPRSEQVRVHPRLNTRTTVPERACPVCGSSVLARVRTVFGDTRDNPALAAVARRTAGAELAAGLASSYLRFAPRGEVDSGGAGSLVQDEHIERIDFEAPDDAGRQGPVVDRWALALRHLGAEEVIVQVDPAVTATESSDETGVVAACQRAPGAGRVRRGVDGAPDVPLSDLPQVVGLEDWSVRAGEVEEGAPSAVWAPRAYRLACLWGASRIVVETNQGGEEVLSAVTDLVRAGLTEARAREWLSEVYPNVAPGRLGVLVRRVVASSRAVRVDAGVHRQASKAARFEWYGRTASVGRQAMLCADWLRDGPQHWQATLGQLTGYEPPRQDARRERPRKDRADVLVGAAQVLLGVRDTEVTDAADHAGDGWMSGVAAGRMR